MVDVNNDLFNDDTINALTGEEFSALKPLVHFKRYAEQHGGYLGDNKQLYQAIYPDFNDFDFRHNTNRTTPVYLNDFDFCLEEDRSRIAALIRMDFNSETFETIAQCQCGRLRGNHMLGSPIKCPECGTKAERLVESDLETKVWLRVPEGVRAFINPGFYKTFFERISTGSPKIRVVNWLIDSSFRRRAKARSTESGRRMMAELEKIGVEPNLNSFIDNADRFMEHFLVGEGLRAISMTAAEGRDFYNLYWRFRDIIFPRYLPVPNRFATIIERDGSDRYVSSNQLKISGIYQSIADTRDTTELYKTTPHDLQENVDIVGKCIVKLANQNSENLKNMLFVKNGTFRKHVIAGSLPYSGRGIITSTTGIHNPGIARIPRVMVVAMLKKFILSHLYRLGIPPLKAQVLIAKAAHRPIKEVDDFIRQAERERDIVCILGRNPTIQHLSIRAFFVKMNEDPEDESINLPILSAAPFNADKLH